MHGTFPERIDHQNPCSRRCWRRPIRVILTVGQAGDAPVAQAPLSYLRRGHPARRHMTPMSSGPVRSGTQAAAPSQYPGADHPQKNICLQPGALQVTQRRRTLFQSGHGLDQRVGDLCAPQSHVACGPDFIASSDTMRRNGEISSCPNFAHGRMTSWPWRPNYLLEHRPLLS